MRGLGLNTGLNTILNYSISQITDNPKPDKNWINHRSFCNELQNTTNIDNCSLGNEEGYSGGRKIVIVCSNHGCMLELVVADSANTCLYKEIGSLEMARTIHVYELGQSVQFHGMEVAITVSKEYVDTVNEGVKFFNQLFMNDNEHT